MNTKIGIGIISFAHGHANAYCNQMRAFDDVQLIACWDDNTERGENAATQYGMHYAPHLEDVINHPEIHAVIVTCETNRHAEMVEAAASEGKAYPLSETDGTYIGRLCSNCGGSREKLALNL